MSQTPEQWWRSTEWLLNAYAEKQLKQKRSKRRDPLSGFTADDYAVRKRGDHYESYNIHTGKALYEAMTIEEARADIREEFMGS